MIKYLFLNDVSYLFHKRKRIMILLILPIIFILLNKIDSITAFEIFNLSMGTNINMDNYLVIEILIFLFTICFYIFLIVDIYVKDIEYQLDLIFLRTNPVKWFLQKSLVFILIVFIIRLIQYLLAILILLSRGYQIVLIDYGSLFITDYVYILLLQFLFLSLYMIGNTFKGILKLTYIIFFIIFCFIPKNILLLENCTFIIVCSIGFLLLLNICIIKRFNKRIIQNL